VARRLSWLLFGGLLMVFVIVIARHSEATAGPLSTAAFTSLGYKIALPVFVGSAALALFRARFTRALTAAFLWIVFALLLLAGHSYRFELRDMADRLMADLLPGHVILYGRTVELARAVNGDFNVRAQINGARVTMVLDTGASSVVLTREDAKAAGLPLEVLSYSAKIDTANGRTLAAPVSIDRIAIGGLLEHSVAALVAQPGQLKTSLLGMSFLNRLQSWEVRGDRLFLRGYP
jgi:aspartyl protease family protein